LIGLFVQKAADGWTYLQWYPAIALSKAFMCWNSIHLLCDHLNLEIVKCSVAAAARPIPGTESGEVAFKLELPRLRDPNDIPG
jgi:hypothetical protein